MPGGNYLAAGIEHNESGAPTANGEMHARMNEKRFRKFNPLKNRRDLFVVEGDPEAPIGLVSWGQRGRGGAGSASAGESGRAACKTAGAQAALSGGGAGLPGLFASVERGLFVEQSFQAQLYRLVRMYVDFPPQVTPLAKSGRTRFSPQKCCNGSGRWLWLCRATGTSSSRRQP